MENAEKEANKVFKSPAADAPLGIRTIDLMPYTILAVILKMAYISITTAVPRNQIAPILSRITIHSYG